MLALIEELVTPTDVPAATQAGDLSGPGDASPASPEGGFDTDVAARAATSDGRGGSPATLGLAILTHFPSKF